MDRELRRFPNGMVDRIAPTVGREEKRRANELTGIDDATPVIAESFIQWVLEDKFVAGRLAFDRVGVELRNDVERSEAIKGRLLNASHMMLSYPALACGYRFVDEALREPTAAAYLDAFMEIDVMPLIETEAPTGVSLQAYNLQVLSRFSNPAMGDQLLRIAHNGFAKLPILLSSIEDFDTAETTHSARQGAKKACAALGEIIVPAGLLRLVVDALSS